MHRSEAKSNRVRRWFVLRRSVLFPSFASGVVVMTVFAGIVSPSFGQKNDKKRSRDIRELADAERAFSATAVKEGFRDSFLKFFAEDGINFGPDPQNTRKALSGLPPQKGPRKVIFRWTPIFADVSAAGDLGYTTGPVLYEDVSGENKPTRHGIYFSVWQKQADGTWKVVVDLGGSVPTAIAAIDAKLVTVRRLRRNTPSTKGVNPEDLDREFAGSVSNVGPLKAYLEALAPEFRLHREGVLPVTDQAVLKALQHLPLRFQYIGGKAASSRDLVYGYGKYFAEGETGYYVHVWRLDAEGKWRLAIEVQSPL